MSSQVQLQARLVYYKRIHRLCVFTLEVSVHFIHKWFRVTEENCELPIDCHTFIHSTHFGKLCFVLYVGLCIVYKRSDSRMISA